MGFKSYDVCCQELKWMTSKERKISNSVPKSANSIDFGFSFSVVVEVCVVLHAFWVRFFQVLVF